MTQSDDQLSSLIQHYESCLSKHGASPQGVDWPSASDLEVRFNLMLTLTNHITDRCTLLDLGCGPGLLLDYLSAVGRINDFDYTGMDISEVMITTAKSRWPEQNFFQRDVLKSPCAVREFDIVLMNGVLTEKHEASFDVMKEYAQKLIKAAYLSCRHGIAFNVMSKFVDWERDDLFHWSLDEVGQFISRDVSRHFEICHSYGLYEYMVFVFREPVRHGTVKESQEHWWKR